MNPETVSSNDNGLLTNQYASRVAARYELAPIAWSAALYATLLWLCWPSLNHPALSLQDRAWLDALAPLSLREAIGYVGHTPLRPGEDLFFWLIAHSGVLWPWRAAIWVVFLLTTAFIQYDATRRGESWIIGVGTAACFAINPTMFSVVCWLSAAHVGLSGLGLLAYFECARRALQQRAHARGYAAFALAGLCFALAFYELAVLAPLLLWAWHGLFATRKPGDSARWLYLGSLACIGGYALLQIGASRALPLWAGKPATEAFANAMRYGLRNFWDWFYPFASFGVLVPDDPTAHAVENALCGLLGVVELVVLWKLRRVDPTTVFGGLWSLVFLVPACAFLHFESSPIAPHYIYIPMLGLVYPGVRLFTLLLDRLAARLTSNLLRLLIGLPISVFLLGSLAPLIAECHATVRLWGNEQQLYLATLRNHPDNAEVLGRLTRDYLGRADTGTAQAVREREPWQAYLDDVLMRPTPDSAPALLREGHALIERAQYVEAGAAFARALDAGQNRAERLEAGMRLALALSHTEQRESAGPLVERLRHEYLADTATSLTAP